MGRPRLRGEGGRGSPRFMEMVVNVPKSLTIAAALHPEVSEALDAAQRDAVAEIRSWLGQHSVTRVGSRGKQEVVPIEQLETVAVSHKTSRAGDPHRHIHFQIGTRVWAAGRWRGLYTAALFRQQGAIRALGTAVIAAHPQLAAVLDAHGLTLDPVTGEVAELVPWNAVMSKRGQQVARNLAKFEADWEAAHPGQEPGPVVRARLHAKAWDHERPSKKPSVLGSEAGWLRELQEAGYTPDLPRAAVQPLRTLDELAVQQVASRALDRCAAAASAWTVHEVQEQVARIVTEAGVRATREELRAFISITTRLAADDCLSILPPDAPRLDHVAHLTTLHVVAVETELRDRLAARATRPAHGATPRVPEPGLDADQARAAAALASTRPLVVVEGAAGAGKTTMLGAAIRAAGQEGRSVRVVTPTKKAADVAAVELGVPTDSVAALVYDHGFRWNADGVWTRLAVGDTDPVTGATYRGPAKENRLAAAERVVVDEAGMLDQDTALALLTVADEAGATLALVGDRAQLPAAGRGGVLDSGRARPPRLLADEPAPLRGPRLRAAHPRPARRPRPGRAVRPAPCARSRAAPRGRRGAARRGRRRADRRSRDHCSDQRRGARAERPDPRGPGARGRGRRRPHHRRRGRPEHRRRRPDPDPPQRLGGGRGEPADLDSPACQRRRQPMGARRREPAQAAAHRASARRVRGRARAPGLRRAFRQELENPRLTGGFLLVTPAGFEPALPP
ncbi:AAA family ATPase [Microbacterium sp. NPDC080220]|uniref:AAA family ATPase n=1 Tax=Microbacterium sp. NPDC080220 TaxID=3161017 RepID=UPI00343722D0